MIGKSIRHEGLYDSYDIFAGVLICTAAIGENADKSTLKDISGNSAGQKCYESYTDWDQYISRMTKVKDGY